MAGPPPPPPPELRTARADVERFIAEGGFERLMSPPPIPMFVSQSEFRQMIVIAESLGWPDGAVFGARPLLVHPDSLRWYERRLARRRLIAHFELCGDD